MKNKFYLAVAAIFLLLFSINSANAAFIIKKAQVQTVSESQATAPEAVATTQSSGTEKRETIATTVETKHSFFSRAFKFLSKPKKAVMSQLVYVILAIIGFGWLAMGINENFQDLDWLLCLLFYILFWLPGFIYTLIKMKKFY